MENLNYLKPVGVNNAIKETVISVFLAQPIFRPWQFVELVKRGGLKDKFQKVEELSSFGIRLGGVKVDPINIIPEQKREVGFQFTAFAEGTRIRVLKGLNDEIRQYFSFHALKYPGWNDFIAEFHFVMEQLNEFRPGMIAVANSLHYIDEFQWNSELPFPTKQVFKQNSNFLPQEFFESQNTHFILSTQRSNSLGNYLDRVEITISQPPIVSFQVSHNISWVNEDGHLFGETFHKDSPFFKQLEWAHKYNKELLCKILTDEVLSLTNIECNAN